MGLPHDNRSVPLSDSIRSHGRGTKHLNLIDGLRMQTGMPAQREYRWIYSL